MPTKAQMEQELAALRAENAKLKASPPQQERKPLLPGRMRLIVDENVPIIPDKNDANPKNCFYGYINIPADLPPGEHRFAIWKNRKQLPDGTFECYPGYHGQLSTKPNGEEDVPA